MHALLRGCASLHQSRPSSRPCLEQRSEISCSRDLKGFQLCKSSGTTLRVHKPFSCSCRQAVSAAAAVESAAMGSDNGLPHSKSPALEFQVAALISHRLSASRKSATLRSTLPCFKCAVRVQHWCISQVVAEQGRARTARMTLPHFTAETPMFMPVGTQGMSPSESALHTVAYCLLER